MTRGLGVFNPIKKWPELTERICMIYDYMYYETLLNNSAALVSQEMVKNPCFSP